MHCSILTPFSCFAIYPKIDNPYGLNEHTRVEEVLGFNPTKGLGERHGFTQSMVGLKP
jgi:hypothetical protein